MRRFNNRFLKFLITLFVIFLLNFYYFSAPVYAFSSLNSCATNTACATSLLSNSGARQLAYNAVVPTGNSFLTVTATNTTTGVLATTSVSSIGTKTMAYGAASALTVGYLTTQSIKRTQEKAVDFHCPSNPSPYCGGAGSKIRYIDHSSGQTIELFSFRTAQMESSSVISNTTNTAYGSETPPGHFYYHLLPDGTTDGSGRTGYSSSIVPIITPYNLLPLDFEDMDGEDRARIIDDYFNNSSDTAVKDIYDLKDIEIPEVEPGEIIEVDVDHHIDDDSDYKPGKRIVTVTDNPDPNPDDDNNNQVGTPIDSPDGDSNNNNDNDSESTGGSTTTTEQEQDNITDLDPDVEPGDGEELIDPEVIPLEPDVIESPNFLQHGVTVFSQKFPFDIFGDPPSVPPSEGCPTYTFFQRTFELCPISELLSLLKYPVIIGFLVWSFMSV